MVQVSFLLPVYNVKPYLKWCLDSIKDANVQYEIICVDDCSTDGSYEYLLEIIDTYNLKVFRNDINRGVSFTRNRLLDLAQGEYIWFVDPDDMICSECAELFYRYAKIENADWCIGDNIDINSNQTEILKTNNKSEQYESFANDREVINCFSRNQNGAQVQGMCFGLLNRRFLDEHKIRFKENISMGEDALFSYEFFLFFKKVIRFNIICYNRRIRPGSACTSFSEERNIKTYKSYLNLYILLLEWVKTNHYNPPGKCNNLETLKIKLVNTQENIARCLAMIKNKQFIKKELKRLKKDGTYPYSDPNNYLHKEKGLKGFLIGHLNKEPIFWLVHILYTFKKAR